MYLGVIVSDTSRFESTPPLPWGGRPTVGLPRNTEFSKYTTGIGLGVGRLLREQDIARFDTLIPDAEGRAAHKGGCQYGNLNRVTGEGPTPWPNQGFQCQKRKSTARCEEIGYFNNKRVPSGLWVRVPPGE